MLYWNADGERRVVADKAGVVVFDVRSGRLEENDGIAAQIRSTQAVLVTTDDGAHRDIEEGELLNRVLAALRTQVVERTKNARFLAGPDGVDQLRTTSYQDGDFPVLEIRWLKHDPTGEEIAAVEEKLKELLS
ncbi:hypothetical protein [Pseudoduganella sp. OTU4001]|uniref:hypothetical protein n=1 Tax=Pseudoduganella sp. OTU4001 TaxID=3043854 RepID=UPI00313DF356